MSVQLRLYTSSEVAEVLRLNHQVVQRKLQAGEIPAYRIGREWRVEHDQLMEWLERHSNQRAPRTRDQKVLDTFFDDAGRLTQIPTQRAKRLVVLRKLVEEFQPDRAYPERELNAILRRFHDDVASLRRNMIEEKLLARTTAGIYKRRA